MTSSQTTPRYTYHQLIESLLNETYGAHLEIVHIVHLIKYDPFDVSDQIGALIQHAPQDLGCHD